MNACLFKKVKCKAYLSRVYDGRYIQVYDKGRTENGNIEASYMEGEKETEIPCDMDGGYDFLKTYYERKEKEFTGFAVGFKEITVTGYLTVTYDDDPYCGERVLTEKHPKDIVNCAIVYYANNRKRFVPVDDIEILQEVDHEQNRPNA